MHGLIVNQLRQYVTARYGRDAWTTLAGDAEGLGSVPTMERTYPDEVVTGIVLRASAMTKVPVFALLRDFGVYLAGALLRIYEPLLRKEWRTLDVIEHTEEQIHTAVRARDAYATPPALAARRVSPTEVVIDYSSPRRLCAVAEGIAQGLADRFGDTITIEQSECMHRGDARCLIQVRLAQP